MAGIRKIRTCILIMMIITFQYVLSKIYCGEYAYTSLFNVIFLNFDQMHTYHLNRFSIEFLIPFVFLFHIVYNNQIEFLHVNTSFLTMYMHKRSKEETIMEILQKTGIDLVFCFCISILTIIGLTFIDIFLFQEKEESINILIVLIYIFRYVLFVYFSISCLRMKALKKEIHFEVMMPYAISVGMIIVDYIFGTHLITYTDHFINECLYLFGYIIIGMIIEAIMIQQFRKGDFV